jgi:adenine deaminase
MLVAARSLAECGGGVVSVLNGDVLARAGLPVAGLMSPLPVAEIAEQVTQWENSMPDLGMPPVFPLDLLALALPVIPEVRLTDMGLVDVGSQTFISLTA